MEIDEYKQVYQADSKERQGKQPFLMSSLLCQVRKIIMIKLCFLADGPGGTSWLWHIKKSASSSSSNWIYVM